MSNEHTAESGNRSLRPNHWDVKVYDDDGAERETVRGLNMTQADILMKIFGREGVQAQSMAFTSHGDYVRGESQSVNWETGVSIDG